MFWYERLPGRGKRWRVVLRFGASLTIAEPIDRAASIAEVEKRVQALSAPRTT